MLRVVDLHTSLLGSICKLTKMGVELEKQYSELFGIGNPYVAQDIFYFCHMGGKYEMSLIFIDQKPFSISGVTWYCVKEIGDGVMGDWHWYSLNQLLICKE